MMKKIYFEPQMEVIMAEGQEFLAFSGGGTGDDPIIDANPDSGTGDNLAPLLPDDFTLFDE
jgi:hypothetical protein